MVDDIRQQQQDNQTHGTTNNYNTNDTQQQQEQIFECPFCTSISFSFSSRCPVCGEEWGVMMWLNFMLM